MAVDSLWANTVLLLPLSEDLQDVAKRRPFAAYGNAALSSAVGTPFGAGKAAYFDGTGDYLRCPVNAADYDLGTGDFDLAAWVYIAGNSAVNTGGVRTALIFSVNSSSNVGKLEFQIWGDASTTGTRLGIWNGTVGYDSGVISGGISQGAWHFLRVKRVSGTVSFYVDEVQKGSSGSFNVQFGGSVAGDLMAIGGRAISGWEDVLNGYIWNARITKGAARPTSLPTAPFPLPTLSGRVYDVAGAPAAKTILVHDRSTQRYLGGANSDPTTGIYTFYPPDFGECQVTCVDGLFDPYTNECVFDLNPSVGIVGGTLAFDSKGHALSYYNEAKINADGVSFEFDGSADSIYSTSSDYILGTDDFSIELEFYPINGGHGSAYSRILQIGPNTTAGTLVIDSVGSSNPMTIEAYFYDTTYRVFGGGSGVTLANNTWHKLQLRRVNGVFTLTINDTTWVTSSTTAYNISASQLVLGGNTSNTESFYGRIGKVRISRGARRAAAAIPTSLLLKLPADGETGLLNALIRDRVIPDSP